MGRFQSPSLPLSSAYLRSDQRGTVETGRLLATRFGCPGAAVPVGGGVMVQAYILIQTEVGRSRGVSDAIAQLEGVAQTDEVTGPYDIIVRIEADSVEGLGKLVIAKVQEVPGVTRTLTCTVVRG